MEQPGKRVKVLILGLDASLATELQSVLPDDNAVHSEPFLSARHALRDVDRLRPDLVFCSADREQYAALLSALAEFKPDLPVVVVSRTPEVVEWLDAIEAGASDYCAAPFEQRQIKWILESTLKHHPAPALYKTA